MNSTGSADKYPNEPAVARAVSKRRPTAPDVDRRRRRPVDLRLVAIAAAHVGTDRRRAAAGRDARDQGARARGLFARGADAAPLRELPRDRQLVERVSRASG